MLQKPIRHLSLRALRATVGCRMHLGVAALGLSGHAKTSRADCVVRGPFFGFPRGDDLPMGRWVWDRSP